MQRSPSNPKRQIQVERRHSGGLHEGHKNKKVQELRTKALEARVTSPPPRLLGKIPILGDPSCIPAFESCTSNPSCIPAMESCTSNPSRIPAMESCTSNPPPVFWSIASNSPAQGVGTDAHTRGLDMKDDLAQAEVVAKDSPIRKLRSPSPRQSTPRRRWTQASTPERQPVANLTPRANVQERSPQPRSGGIVKRSSSTPRVVQLETPEKPPGSPIPAPMEAPDEACFVEADVLAWLDNILKPKPRPSQRQRPQALKEENEIVRYSEIQFGEPIGSGTFGTVFKGVCRGFVVAIKQCKLAGAQDAEMLVREIGYLQKLRHPRLVSFLGCSRKSPFVILLMEFMPGGSLFTLLFKQTKVQLRLVESMMMAWQLSEGLLYIHDLGIVHRDLKTMNIVLDKDYNCKICDFGLSVTLERTHLTLKDFAGTPKYMAPEQFITNGKITEKVDIWAMGCVMLELFCRQSPFPQNDAVQISKHLLIKSRPPRIPQEADPRARTLIHVCLQIPPHIRPNAEVLLEALEGLCKHAGEADNVMVRRF